MDRGRRGFLAGAAALALCSCGGGGAPRGLMMQAQAAERPNPFVVVPDPGWNAWVAAFKPRARAAGIPEATLEAAFRGAGYIPAVIERDRAQAEFTRTLGDYLQTAVSDRRVEGGRAALARHAALLAAVEDRFGVDKETVVAVWGLESSYGENRGQVPVVSALSTLAYDGRRGAFFESQLLSALRILARGDITPERMTGSWAGAMGHTQFIPTSFEEYAVDFTGDGRRDIWSDDPSDALASAANYLARAGWRRGQPWGVQVVTDEGAGDARRTAAEWAARGVRPAAGGSLPDAGPARLIRPSGQPFLVYRNFDVIRRYNAADTYAIGIGHLSDRLRGRPPLVGLFSSERPLTEAERIELQTRLSALGFDTGGTDGTVGPRTIQAIRDFQAARGLPVTGFAEPSVLQALRR